MAGSTRRRTILKSGGVAALAVATGAGARSATSAAAPAADRPDLQASLDNVVASGASGALAEFRDGASVWRGTSGVAELGTSRPVPVGGRFRIGSVTKTFVATMVLKLVEQSRLRLDDRVEQWLPGAITNGDRITLRNLLQHTSGVFDFISRFSEIFPTPEDLVRQRFRSWSPSELLALAADQPPVFEPGTSWSYSNTNYFLLAMVVERATGRRYGAEVERHILHPLGLRNTEVPGNNPFLRGPHSHGYLPLRRDGQIVSADVTTFNPSIAWAAGEIVSTPAEVNRFLRALLTGRVLPPTVLQQMLSNPAGRGYALGIGQFPLPCGDTLWGHTGSFFGYLTYALSTEDGRRQLTVSVNPWGGNPGRAISALVETAFCEMSPAATSAATTPLWVPEPGTKW
jgi:D-alanyl-D-alanine carboxypeptidase